MHLRELKQKSMADLVHMAKGHNIEGAAGLRKQELIFALLQAHPTTTTCPVRMTSMCLLRRFAVLIFAPATA